MQSNMTIIKKVKSIFVTARSSKGYTLLFAVIVSVLVLSIAAFILSVSRKQFILSSSARDSIYSFYASDSGLECAISHLTDLDAQTPPSTISCGSNTSIDVHPDNSNSTQHGTSTFYMFTGTGDRSTTNQTQSGAGSCASTTVAYDLSVAGDEILDDEGQPTGTYTPSEFSVLVISRGYNIGWNPSSGKNDCSITGPRKVERALQYKTLDYRSVTP